VNAQQKNLDVWLIYRCSVCGAIWNLTILSRVTPRTIPPGLLRGFQENDPGLAARYAADAALIKRNGAEPRRPEIEIAGPDIGAGESARIRLVAEQPLEVRVETVLRRKLGLSRSGFDRLLSGGKLVCLSGHNLKKCRLAGEITVELTQE